MPLGRWPKVVCGIVALTDAIGKGGGAAMEAKERSAETAWSGAAGWEGGGVLLLRLTGGRGRGRGVTLLLMALALEGGVVGDRW